MKKTPLKRIGARARETDAQKQIREAYAEAKQFRIKGKPRQNSKKCWADGIKFDSLWERECYYQLKYRLAAKEICNLETHVSYQLEVNGKWISEIIPDFRYYDYGLKRIVIADAKQPLKDKKSNRKLDREGWAAKWRLLQALYPDHQFEVFRMHSGWREYKECSGQKI